MIGVLGGGQLGQMLGLAGIPLGESFRFLDPSPDACAGAVGELVVDGYAERAGLDRLAESCSVITYEFENVPAEAAAYLTQRTHLYPPPAALDVAQDRLNEKRLFEEMGLEVAPYAPADDAAALDKAVAELGTPCVVKTRTEGYDGKGQRVVRDPGDAAGLFAELGSVPLIVEGFVEFERELSILGVRGRDGSTAFYPLVENLHVDGILRRSLAPAPGAEDMQAAAERHAAAVLEALDYVGVLCIELFAKGPRLLANEMAPRVHNSGHWTIEGAETSQFENHVRAVTGLPLGSTKARGGSLMFNVIGEVPARDDVAAVPGAHLHLYGKEPRPGRKLGHVTVTGPAGELQARGDRIASLVGLDPQGSS